MHHVVGEASMVFTLSLTEARPGLPYFAPKVALSAWCSVMFLVAMS